MRGSEEQTVGLFSYIRLEDRIAADHPLRPIRSLVDEVLAVLSRRLSGLYATTGRPSIPAEQLLRATTLMGLARVRRLLSSDHFSVDGTMIDAWASMKSFRPKDGSGDPPGPGRNGERDFRREKRSNETHASTTDPDARLFRKADGQASRLCYLGHALMEHRHALIVDAPLTHATGTAEREAALAMIERTRKPGRRVTLAGDKLFDAAGFVSALRERKVTPHIAVNGTVSKLGKVRKTLIDRRTTRHDGYEISMRIRKRIEEAFGWAKTIGGIARLKVQGIARATAAFTFRMIAYNLVRLPKIIQVTA